MRVAVVGASGFVGRAIMESLPSTVEVQALSAPRFTCQHATVEDLITEADRVVAKGATLSFAGVDVVVNAAGDPDASSRNVGHLVGANALLPAVIAVQAAQDDVKRLIHVSSAVVQGDREELTASEEFSPFSPYSSSKVLGEAALRQLSNGSLEVIRYRPPSVHGVDRRVTRRIAQLASSPIATVASPGDQPSPQALVENVAAAIAFLCLTSEVPPPVVAHPWEGLTTVELMLVLGGRRPKILPQRIARSVLAVSKGLSRGVPRLAANVRRLELIWFGQYQERSWLSDAGFRPPCGRDAWIALGQSVRDVRDGKVGR